MVDIFSETVLPGIAAPSHMNSQLLGLHAQDLSMIKPAQIRAWLEETLMKSCSAEGRGESVFLKDLIPERVGIHASKDGPIPMSI